MVHDHNFNVERPARYYSACDNCKFSKRKCNGERPCSSCIKYKKDNCNFSLVEERKRSVGPKDHVTCDQCRSKKRKCDGDGLNPCLNCIKSKVKLEDGAPYCTYTPKDRKRKRKSFGDMLLMDHENDISLDGIHHHHHVLHTPQPSPIHLHQSSASSSKNMNPPLNQNMNPPLNQKLDQLSQHYVKNFSVHEPISASTFSWNAQKNSALILSLDLEEHLFELSAVTCQAIPLSFHDRFNLTGPLGVSSTISKALKYALFASASMFSAHPELHANTSDPSLKQRLEVAKRFASISLQHLNHSLVLHNLEEVPDFFTSSDDFLTEPLEDSSVSDLCRTMLCLAHFSYGIGVKTVAEKIIHDLVKMSNLFGLFQPANCSRPLWSVDSLVFRIPADRLVPPPKSNSEEHERFCLFASILIFDSYHSMESGLFALDESAYSDLCRGWLNCENIEPQESGKIMTVRASVNTIWEHQADSSLYDIVAKHCFQDLLPSSTATKFNSFIWICDILRKILRSVRSRIPVFETNEFPGNHPDPVYPPVATREFTAKGLHDSLLGWYFQLPQDSKPFPSLEMFVNGVPPMIPGFVLWKFSAPALEGSLLFLCSFCYLHMSFLDSQSSFRLEYALHISGNSSPQPLYSSRQVLIICLRALAYILKELWNNNTTLPSPIQYWSIQPLELFVISSSALLAARIPPFADSLYQELCQLVREIVMPHLEKLSQIWPIASHYQGKLKSLVELTQIS